jgi:hypothetical protein
MAKRKKTLQHGPYFALPHIILEHPDFLSLSGPAIKVFLYLGRQFKPGKNGDLSASFKDMKPRGIGSHTTLGKALEELITANWVIRTRTGRFTNPGGRCALYALTWHPIDECTGKDLEVAPTTTSPRKLTLENYKTPSTGTVATGYSKYSEGGQKEATIIQITGTSLL